MTSLQARAVPSMPLRPSIVTKSLVCACVPARACGLQSAHCGGWTYMLLEASREGNQGSIHERRPPASTLKAPEPSETKFPTHLCRSRRPPLLRQRTGAPMQSWFRPGAWRSRSNSASWLLSEDRVAQCRRPFAATCNHANHTGLFMACWSQC